MKVFCIGESKTGTKSLRNALNMLGMTTVHNSNKFNKAYSNKNEKTINHIINKYDAFLDGPFRYDYKVLDQDKNNKFIFTDRDPIPWIVSSVNHNDRHNKNLDKNKILTLLKDYVEFRKNVLTYFKIKRNFIHLDVTLEGKDSKKWSLLISLLDIRRPSFDINKGKFPCVGSNNNKKYKTLEEIQEHFKISNNEFSAAVKGYRQVY